MHDGNFRFFFVIGCLFINSVLSQIQSTKTFFFFSKSRFPWTRTFSSRYNTKYTVHADRQGEVKSTPRLQQNFLNFFVGKYKKNIIMFRIIEALFGLRKFRFKNLIIFISIENPEGFTNF